MKTPPSAQELVDLLSASTDLSDEIKGYLRRICKVCESPFYAVKGYETECLVCYKKSRGYKLLGGDKQFFAMQDELIDAYEVIADLEVRVDNMKDTCKQLKQQVRQLKREAQVIPATVIEGLDEKMVKKMLLLCHPDHNNGSDKAKEVTEFLIRLKDSL